MSIRAPFSSSQSILGAIFAQIFREFVKVLRDFARILWDFAGILWDFARIFTKSKLLGVRLHPCIPASYTSGFNSFLRVLLGKTCLHWAHLVVS